MRDALRALAKAARKVRVTGPAMSRLRLINGVMMVDRDNLGDPGRRTERGAVGWALADAARKVAACPIVAARAADACFAQVAAAEEAGEPQKQATDDGTPSSRGHLRPIIGTMKVYGIDDDFARACAEGRFAAAAGQEESGMDQAMGFASQGGEKFWMVWREGSPTTRHRHATRELADMEAERLAKANPGEIFFVLKAVGGAIADNPKVRKVALSKASDDIPF